VSSQDLLQTAIVSVGQTLQRLRHKSGMTIQELSNRSGVSVGLLSQIERGRGNPSFSTLFKLSRGLDVPVGYFFSGVEPTGAVVRKAHRKHLSLSKRDPRYELLSPDMSREIELLWIEYPRGWGNQKTQFSHPGEECGVVLQGQLEVHLLDQEYLLSCGDSVYLNSTIPHWFHNPGDEPTVMVWAIHPPSF
jgi:transcriptional regulator with XRE-family HTH domain